MRRNKIQPMEIAQAALSALFVIALLTLLRACGPKEDGTWMHCHSAWKAVVILAAVMLVLSAAKLGLRQPAASAAIDIAVIVLAAVTTLIPGNIVSMCMMHTMRCWSVLRPGVIVFCVLILLAAALDIASLCRAKKGNG